MMIKEMKLSEIVKHRDLQIRESLDLNRVAFLQDVYQDWDPLLVYRVNGKHYLTDGFHRIAAAERLTLIKVKVEIREGSFHDALLAAIEANSAHRGLPLTLKERRKAAELVLKTDTNWADRRIASIVGLSHHTVGEIRRELIALGVIKEVQKVEGKDRIMQSSDNKVGKLPTEDEPEPPPKPWEGKVLCPADAFDILPQEPREHYDLVFTDPPYNITEGENFANLDEYLEFTRRWLLLVLPLIKPSGRLYVCFSYQHLLDALPIMREAVSVSTTLYPFTFGPPIIWHHPNTISAAHNQKEYKPTYDIILYWYGPEAGHLIADDAYTGDERGAVWNIAVPQSNFAEGKWHKFQKPLELVERIIKGATRAGDLVLDPFAGSGTTAVACVTLGRDYKVIEKNPDCLPIIESRLEKVYATNKD